MPRDGKSKSRSSTSRRRSAGPAARCAASPRTWPARKPGHCCSSTTSPPPPPPAPPDPPASTPALSRSPPCSASSAPTSPPTPAAGTAATAPPAPMPRWPAWTPRSSPCPATVRAASGPPAGPPPNDEPGTPKKSPTPSTSQSRISRNGTQLRKLKGSADKPDAYREETPVIFGHVLGAPPARSQLQRDCGDGSVLSYG